LLGSPWIIANSLGILVSQNSFLETRKGIGKNSLVWGLTIFPILQPRGWFLLRIWLNFWKGFGRLPWLFQFFGTWFFGFKFGFWGWNHSWHPFWGNPLRD